VRRCQNIDPFTTCGIALMSLYVTQRQSVNMASSLCLFIGQTKLSVLLLLIKFLAMIFMVTCRVFHMLLTNIILSAVRWTERRQTMLFSATTTQKTEALTRLALKKEPFYVGVDDETDKATVEGLEQGL